MKIIIVFSVVMPLFLLVSAARAQLPGVTLPEEGRQVVAESQFLIKQAEQINAVKNPDRSWLIEKGHLLIKHGIDAVGAGEMMYTDKGRINMQQLGKKMHQAGGLLLRMGRKNGETTPAEKAQIQIYGKELLEFGKLMINNGKLMAGN